uniref:Interleukin-4 n=1 Tax=Zonotrichia albicollis TaxID=44394 RepID=A0A8D2MQA6_ZONAL
MLPTLKAAFALLSLLQLVSGTPVTSSHPQQALKEITTRIQAFNSEAQLPEQELLCQAQVALTKVTMCKKIYEPLISNLKFLHGKRNCNLSDDNEIYLRHFLPALGNFTQGMFRRRGWAAQ